MSQATNYLENKLADWVLRQQAWSKPASLYAGLASAAADGSITELTGTGYGRQALTRALTTWKSTQGDDLASTGTTHTTSNSAAINFGTAGSNWAPAGSEATHLVIHDASTSGNPWAFIPLPNGALAIANGDPVSFAAGSINFSIGLAGGCTDYLANKLIDDLFRGQAWTPPVTMHEATFSGAPTNAGGGTESSYTAYARVAVACSLANISGTQGAGTTSASSGTSGLVSNNAAISFATPGGAGAALVACGEYDAASGGNLLFYAALATARSILSGGDPPRFDAGKRTWTFA